MADAKKEYKPGDPITWTHYMIDGTAIVRTGTVWARAPKSHPDGMFAQLVNWWVIPDQPLPTDIYAAIAVGRAPRHNPAHGTWLDGSSNPWVDKGDLYASNYIASPTGALAHHAAMEAYKVRKERQERMQQAA